MTTHTTTKHPLTAENLDHPPHSQSNELPAPLPVLFTDIIKTAATTLTHLDKETRTPWISFQVDCSAPKFSMKSGSRNSLRDRTILLANTDQWVEPNLTDYNNPSMSQFPMIDFTSTRQPDFQSQPAPHTNHINHSFEPQTQTPPYNLLYQPEE